MLAYGAGRCWSPGRPDCTNETDRVEYKGRQEPGGWIDIDLRPVCKANPTLQLIRWCASAWETLGRCQLEPRVVDSGLALAKSTR
ncbi:hypothetical protein KRMM14A1004_46860 [Krasilnikovia sp. MM14-A1004]